MFLPFAKKRSDDKCLVRFPSSGIKICASFGVGSALPFLFYKFPEPPDFLALLLPVRMVIAVHGIKQETVMFYTHKSKNWYWVHYRTLRFALEAIATLGVAALCSYLILRLH
jgi:hypothetical protein